MACMSCMSNQFLIDNWQQTDKNVWRNKCKYTPFHLYNRDLSLRSYEERGMASPHPSDVTSSVSHLPSHISISCLHIVSTQNVVTRNLWKTWSNVTLGSGPLLSGCGCPPNISGSSSARRHNVRSWKCPNLLKLNYISFNSLLAKPEMAQFPDMTPMTMCFSEERLHLWWCI